MEDYYCIFQPPSHARGEFTAIPPETKQSRAHFFRLPVKFARFLANSSPQWPTIGVARFINVLDDSIRTIFDSIQRVCAYEFVRFTTVG
jgi:hypothetical protein